MLGIENKFYAIQVDTAMALRFSYEEKDLHDIEHRNLIETTRNVVRVLGGKIKKLDDLVLRILDLKPKVDLDNIPTTEQLMKEWGENR